MMADREFKGKKYQIAGLDERERGFCRIAEITRSQGSYKAVLHYETQKFISGSFEDEGAVLPDLIQKLQERGYRELRSQLAFQGEEYLGSQHEWTEYPDPDRPRAEGGGFFSWLRGLFKP